MRSTPDLQPGVRSETTPTSGARARVTAELFALAPEPDEGLAGQDTAVDDLSSLGVLRDDINANMFALREMSRSSDTATHFFRLLQNFTNHITTLQTQLKDTEDADADFYREAQTTSQEYQRYLATDVRETFEQYAQSIIDTITETNRGGNVKDMLGAEVIETIKEEMATVEGVYGEPVSLAQLTVEYRSPNKLVEEYFQGLKVSTRGVNAAYFNALEDLCLNPAVKHYSAGERRELITMLTQRLTPATNLLNGKLGSTFDQMLSFGARGDVVKLKAAFGLIKDSIRTLAEPMDAAKFSLESHALATELNEGIDAARKLTSPVDQLSAVFEALDKARNFISTKYTTGEIAPEQKESLYIKVKTCLWLADITPEAAELIGKWTSLHSPAQFRENLIKTEWNGKVFEEAVTATPAADTFDFPEYEAPAPVVSTPRERIVRIALAPELEGPLEVAQTFAEKPVAVASAPTAETTPKERIVRIEAKEASTPLPLYQRRVSSTPVLSGEKLEQWRRFTTPAQLPAQKTFTAPKGMTTARLITPAATMRTPVSSVLPTQQTATAAPFVGSEAARKATVNMFTNNTGAKSGRDKVLSFRNEPIQESTFDRLKTGAGKAAGKIGSAVGGFFKGFRNLF